MKSSKKIISYKTSPAGKAYIGIAKLPLIPNKSGFGFQGVLLQDEKKEFIQCSNCGNWFKKINNSHVWFCMKTNIVAYRKKFGLLKTTGLVSNELSLRLQKHAITNLGVKKGSSFFSKKNNNAKIYNQKSNQIRRDKYSDSIEWKNRFGTCDAQLKVRLYEFIRINKELPLRSNKGYTIYNALVDRFKSFGDALVYFGLPKFTRKGNQHYLHFRNKIHCYIVGNWEERQKVYQKLYEYIS